MSNQFVTDGLRVKLSEIASNPRAAQHRVRAPGEAKATILARLRLFDDEGAGSPTLGIPRGSFRRTILEVLRNAGEPLSTRQIAERLAEGKTMDKRQMD